MNIQIGQQAPDFTLFNTEKNKISLSDYKGKNVVILFFPLAFTGTCTTEMCHMRDHMSLYNGFNAEIIGISVDSLFVLDRFKKENNLDFTLLSDFNKTACKDYGCLYEMFSFEMQGVSKRAAFIVDKDGNIQYAEVLESAGELPNFEAIQECLAQLV
ncbi:MAG: peroxiredoxin [Bacteroidetes bacterium]|jgi:peroxiredoxin|nr:peroxiredoxin [Bacteroidota bacterium]HMT34233.1 peroxiredoxin [Chitinophagaceae bacterium]MBK7041634.1 peroxiredoxin [Bacteroidota bacterium]MBK7588293.1 peroxiredoxin [Bacteroidota bacterium]MBK8330095.1 peroxiredoxin [Bacteroidota bacterium]